MRRKVKICGPRGVGWDCPSRCKDLAFIAGFQERRNTLSQDSPCAQRRGVGAPRPGPKARQQGACALRRLCSWKDTRRPAASASKPDTTSASASGYTKTPGGGHRAGVTGVAVAPHTHRWPASPRVSPTLTVHGLRLGVAVGEPHPQTEAGAVGAGPHPRVGERQRRPAGGAVQAGHGAPAGEGAPERGCGPGTRRQLPLAPRVPAIQHPVAPTCRGHPWQWRGGCQVVRMERGGEDGYLGGCGNSGHPGSWLNGEVNE